MSTTWNAGAFNAVPWNGGAGVAAAPVVDALLTLAVTLAYDLTLSVEVAGVATATIDVGDRVTVSAAFVDDAGATVDPTTVTFSQQTPDGTITDYVYGVSGAVAKSSTGNYTFKHTVTQAGKHVVRVTGAGAAIAAEKTSYQAVSEY